MIIWHVYNVSMVYPIIEPGDLTGSKRIANETVVAMNTSEARDQVAAKYGVSGSYPDVQFHIHELTRFNTI